MISSLDARMHRRTGRTIGVLLLVQIVVAPIVNFGAARAGVRCTGIPGEGGGALVQVSVGALSDS